MIYLVSLGDFGDGEFFLLFDAWHVSHLVDGCDESLLSPQWKQESLLLLPPSPISILGDKLCSVFQFSALP